MSNGPSQVGAEIVTARGGFLCTLRPGDWLLIRPGGEGRTEEVIASGTEEYVCAVAADRMIRPAVIVKVADAHALMQRVPC